MRERIVWLFSSKRNIWGMFFVVMFFATVPSLKAQVEPVDNNVWIYSSLFVDRFGLSVENVSPSLAGAQGVAVRLVPLTRPRCHETSNGEECVASYQWLMDIYIDVDKDIGIQGNAARQFIPWRSSVYFLGRHDPSLANHLKERFGLKGGKLYRVEKDGSRTELEFNVFSYKRPIEKGLQVVEAKVSGDAVLDHPELDREVTFADSAGKIVHRVRIPAVFWPKVVEYRQQYPEIIARNWSGGYEKDPHIWTYTKEFAEQYGLPQENISSDMDGAMAIAFRMDTDGVKRCGYLNDSDHTPYCNGPSFSEYFDVYFPPEKKIIYMAPDFTDFYKGFAGSSTFLHEQQEKFYDRNLYPHLVESGGFEFSALIYRHKKRNFFNLIETEEMDRWLGGAGVFPVGYLQAGVLQHRFTFVESVVSLGRDQEDEYYLFPATELSVSNQRILGKYTHAKIPVEFIKRAFLYENELRKIILENIKNANEYDVISKFLSTHPESLLRGLKAHK